MKKPTSKKPTNIEKIFAHPTKKLRDYTAADFEEMREQLLSAIAKWPNPQKSNSYAYMVGNLQGEKTLAVMLRGDALLAMHRAIISSLEKNPTWVHVDTICRAIRRELQLEAGR